jgi:hypothetical protein
VMYRRNLICEDVAVFHNILCFLTLTYWCSVLKCESCAVAQLVSRQPRRAKAWFYFRANSCGVCGRQSWTSFSLGTLVFPYHYHSASTLYSFIPLSLILYNLSNRQLCWVTPFNNIPVWNVHFVFDGC